ncbi:unnamed protein product [Eruca vesicaria subsp. sativa]|uniref:Uncharacterized protein n=1 Tax=Eruca vesicaria subsp. sativa TaxID=29727 RepID=A0ABC8KQK8_ERUVS|nr:unnamed protein product [Eruca vesicaria subsp. sativa]
MARLVFMSKRVWSKSQHGVWRFEDDLAVMPQSFLVRRNEEYPSLEMKVRSIYNLERQVPLVVTFQLPQWMVETDVETVPPPHIIRTDEDIDMLLSVHEWNTDPKLCIVFGAREVAKYHYICMIPFTIGRQTYLGEGVTEEQHLAMVNAIMTEGQITCSEEVIKFTGYLPKDLNIVNSDDHQIPQYQVPVEVSSTASSTELNTRVEIRDLITNSTLGTESKFGNLISEKGESSRRENGEEVINGEMQDATDLTTQTAQRNADGVSDGNRFGEQGGK